MSNKTHQIAVIPGDGIGTEFMPEGVRGLEVVCVADDVRDQGEDRLGGAPDLRSLPTGGCQTWARAAGSSRPNRPVLAALESES